MTLCRAPEGLHVQDVEHMTVIRFDWATTTSHLRPQSDTVILLFRYSVIQ